MLAENVLRMHFSSHFPIQPSLRRINHNKMDVKGDRKSLLVGENASQAAETIGKG